MSELEPRIPYLGNKAGILDELYETIRNLDIDKPIGIYDAFTGGGSFAYYMAQKGFKVVANDIESGVIDLHRHCKQFPEWVKQYKDIPITRDEFNIMKKDDTYIGAMIRSMWSFSNQGGTYLCAKSKEDKKIAEFLAGKAEPNQRYSHIEDIILLHSRVNLDLEFIEGSYSDFDVPKGWLIYCDPPYAGKHGYKSGKFDHDTFYKWALEQDNVVLISEYSMPKEFYLVAEFSKWNEGGGALNKKKGIERLYSNKPIKLNALF